MVYFPSYKTVYEPLKDKGRQFTSLEAMSQHQQAFRIPRRPAGACSSYFPIQVNTARIHWIQLVSKLWRDHLMFGVHCGRDMFLMQ